MSVKIQKANLDEEMQQKRLAACAEIIEETGDNDKIFRLIHEKYSISQELCLHRKKLMGTISDNEWKEYCDYVEECIKQVEDDTTPEA